MNPAPSTIAPEKAVSSTKFAEYSVGRICALPDELDAVRAMLDVEHAMPKCRADANDNTYFLSGIGQHNVVIAGLPASKPGAAAAVTVVVGM